MGIYEDYKELRKKADRARNEACNQLTNWNFKKAREYLKEVDKYDTQISDLPSITQQVDDAYYVLLYQVNECEAIQYLLKSVYDAIEADKYAEANSFYDQCWTRFHKYRCGGKCTLDDEMLDKFRADIIDAGRFIKQNRNDWYARQELRHAKELAKNKKFDDALNVLATGEPYAGNSKTLNLIWDERLKIEKDRQREKEVKEIEESNRGANANLQMIPNCIKNLKFQDAITYCERAAYWARDATLQKKIKTEKRNVLERAYNFYINEAETLVKENKCKAAYSKFDEASRMAKDPLLERKYLIDLEAKINSSCNVRAQYLQKIANELVKEKKVNEAMENFQEALCFARDNSIRNSIIADKDKEMTRVENDNKRALQLLEIAKGHVIKNDFKLAETTFRSALECAADEALITTIKTEEASANSKQVKYLQNEANDLLSQNKLKESIDKFKEAIYIVKDDSEKKSLKTDKSKVVNQYVNLLLDQASELVKQNKFEEAYDKFEKALNIDEDVSHTVRICKAQANALNQEGMIHLKKSFELESSEPFTETKYKEAEKKLNRAKELFTKAENASETKQEKNVKIVESKIDGNKCFNEALLQEEAAFDLYENAKKYNELKYYTSAQEKYQKAKELYEKAKEHFTTGFKLGCPELQVSKNLASDQISNIPKVITSINMLKLKCNVSKLDKQLEDIKNKL